MAAASGVRVGMPLAEARALCVGLIDQPAEPEKDLRALEAMGYWLRRRFTPVVSLEPPAALLLDLTGCERLFGGVDRLVAFIRSAIVRLGFTARLAVAPTIGAAWAMTFAENTTQFQISDLKSISSSLDPLHVATLRLDASAVGTLLHLGVETIGQLLAFDRTSLLSRFGPGVLLRIDQALGDAPEVIRPLPHRTAIRTRMDFDGPVSSLEAIHEVLRHMAQDVSNQLAVIGSGARRIEAEFRPPYGQLVQKTVLLSRPTRNVRALFNLLRCATEELETGDDGFLRITLTVPLHERVADEQPTLDGECDTGGLSASAALAEVTGLVEVLTVRLSPTAVLVAKPQEQHLPELAYRMMPAVEGIADQAPRPVAAPVRKGKKSRPKRKSLHALRAQREAGDAEEVRPLPARSAGRLPEYAATESESESFLRLTPPWEPVLPHLPEGADDPERTDTERLPGPQDPSMAHAPQAARPLRLLPTPRLLQAMSAEPLHGDDRLPISFVDDRQVYRVAHAAGPERIAGPWWEGRDKTRDYYDIETTEGRRLWIFRVAETGRWYLHGGFE